MEPFQMTVEEWDQVPDNPRQRDTERRALLASKRHLSVYQDIHKYVYCGVRNGKIVCKVDGHTRSYVWRNGMADGPSDGRVVVCPVEITSEDGGREIYGQTDGKGPTKTPGDLLYGACKDNGIVFQSPLLKRCSFMVQLKFASSGPRFSADLFGAIVLWKDELMVLDQLNLTGKYNPLVALMLVTIHKDGVNKAGQFFCLLDQNKGRKCDGKVDGVEMLSEYWRQMKADGKWGWDNLTKLYCVGWFCYHYWCLGELRCKLPRKSIRNKALLYLSEVNGVRLARKWREP